MGGKTYRKNFKHTLVGDFETTVYEGQTETEVWASALVEMHHDDVAIYHSIDETFEALRKLNGDVMVYYHNLKFDGMFWIDYLIRKLKFQQAFEEDEDGKVIDGISHAYMDNNTFNYLMSDMGQLYKITIRVDKRFIELRDSLKLLPFSVEELGRSFGTEHKKLNMKYEGYRYAGCEITEEEKRYIANDVLVVKEALELFFEDGKTGLTIGACCMNEWKRGQFVSKDDRQNVLYDLLNEELDEAEFGSPNADAYVRKAYRGGWCYVNPKYQGRVLGKGYTLDVNSLYPSMMLREDRLYPFGKPHFWKGEIPHEAFEDDRYYFVRVRVKFRIKDYHLPFIQNKHNFRYKGNECLTTSNFIDKNGDECEYYVDEDGNRHEVMMEITLTKTDWELFCEHYDILKVEFLDGCWFNTMSGKYWFGNYIRKYKEQKQTTTGAKRQLAKLFLNNLYGKLATSDNSSFKYFTMGEDEILHQHTVIQYDKIPIYIPMGCAITSYARDFTIRAAQRNYRNFVYADTDSIHCVGDVKDVRGVELDNTEFSCWKHESDWSEGFFLRQKSYIEKIHGEYDIKCAGMNKRCKYLLNRSLTGELAQPGEELSEAEREFLSKKRELTDFNIGLSLPSKLVPKIIKGGVILVTTDFTIS